MSIFLVAASNPLGGVFKGAFSGAGSSIKSIVSKFMWGFFILLLLGVISYFIYNWYKNKIFYTTPVTLTVIMDNGMQKTRTDLRGGIFVNRGVKDFKVKAPKKRKTIILGYIPDLSKSNYVDGRVHFITFGDQTIWIQVEEKWVLKDKEGYDLVKTPISRETKQVTINAIKNWRDTVDKTKLTAFGIAIGAFIIMVIAHLISLFIQTRIKCGTPA